MKKDKVKTEFTETWYFPLLIFFGVPAGIILRSNNDSDGYGWSFNTKLVILFSVYIVNFLISLLYIYIEKPKNLSLWQARDGIKVCMLLTSVFLPTPFIFLLCLKGIFVRIIQRIKGE
jgi:hypothetical protein